MTDTKEKLWITNLHISEGAYPIYGLYREEPLSEKDSGWRVVSEADTEEYLNNVANVTTLEEAEMLLLEPALAAIKDLPVGTELEMIQDETTVRFVDFNTREPVTK